MKFKGCRNNYNIVVIIQALYLNVNRSNKFRTVVTLLSLLLALVNPLADSVQAAPRRHDVAGESCEGIGTPMTKAAVIQRASLLNIPNTGNQVETAFEAFAIRSLSVPPNVNRIFRYESELRQRRSGNTESFVEPDSAIPVEYARIAIVNGEPVVQEVVIYLESFFYDSKLVKGRIRNKDGNYQILGFLDALLHSPAGRATRPPQNLPPNRVPPPRMAFLTGADAYIAKDVKDFADEHKIALFQYVVCDNIPNGGRLGSTDLIMGRGVLINPGVFTNPTRPTPIEIPLGAGTPNTLAPLPPPPTTSTPPPSGECIPSADNVWCLG